MENNQNEEKQLHETIRILLKTTEDLKSAVVPIGQGQEHILNVLKAHEEAVASLMDKLIGTQQEHIKTLSRLELLESNVTQLGRSHEDIQDIKAALEERLRKIELKEMFPIVQKINDATPPSNEDLNRIDNLLVSYPNDEYLLSMKAQALYLLDKKEEALHLLEEAVSKEPHNSRLWYTKGLISESFEDRLKCFDKSLEELKDGSTIAQHLVNYSRASLLYHEKKFDEALVSITKSVEMNTKCDQGWQLKGKTLFKLNRIPEALGCFEKAIEIDAKSNEVWYWKGLALSALGSDYSAEAIASYDKAIELDSTWAIPYLDKGILLSQGDEYEKALQSFDAGLKWDDQNTCAWCDRGIALNRMGRNGEAIESFNKALKLSVPETCSLIFANTAIVLYHLKRYEEALDFMKRALESEPQNVLYLDVLGCCLFRQGKDKESLEAFEKALSLRKDDNDIDWDDLAALYYRIGRTKEAEEARQRFQSMKKTD